MKSRNLVPLLATILLSAGAMFAQSAAEPIRVTIPFAFSAGKYMLPAGEYRVVAVSGTGHVSMIGTGSAMGIVSSHAVEASRRAAKTKPVFYRYGQRYFLRQVWAMDDDTGREFPATKVEEELQHGTARRRVVTVLARR